MNRDDMKATLLKNVCDVRFTKVDGTTRDMRCTLKEDLLPEPVASDTEINRNRKPNDSVQVVWDLDKKEFRVFNWNTVKGDVTHITNFRVDNLV